MPNWLRAIIAGYGAKKLGGGCFSTIIVFIVLWYLLGQCGGNNTNNSGNYNRQSMTAPAKPAQPTALKPNTVRLHRI
jgi:hypothetical protein